MRPHRLVSASSCFRRALVKWQYFARRLVSGSPQNEEIQPSSSIRCSAGKSEHGLTTKVLPVICWILREIRNPRISPTTSDFKISMSKVLARELSVQNPRNVSYRHSIGIVLIDI